MFVPAYGAYRQGIVLTVPIELRLLPAGVTGEQLHACLAHHYADARHVDVTPLAETHAITHLDPQALNGTNDLRLVNADHGGCCPPYSTISAKGIRRGRAESRPDARRGKRGESDVSRVRAPSSAGLDIAAANASVQGGRYRLAT